MQAPNRPKAKRVCCHHTPFGISYPLLALPSALLPEPSLPHAPPGTIQTIPRHTPAVIPPPHNPAMALFPECPVPATQGIPPLLSPDYPLIC